MKEVMKCPVCRRFGLDSELEELWYDDGKRKVYRCKREGHELCDHMLNATRRDLPLFACGNCFADSIEECQCMDCGSGVFCSECNSFLNVDCEDVMGVIYDNEERKGAR